MKKPVPTPLLRLQYRVILSKMESGMMKVPVRSVLATVLKARHVFRGGTSIDDDTVRKKYYKDLIAKCKVERAAKKSASTKKKNIKNKSTARVDLIGRRVVMCADVFGGNENEFYNGSVMHVCTCMLHTCTCSHNDRCNPTQGQIHRKWQSEKRIQSALAYW